MNVTEIEGVRIAAGETLIIVGKEHWPQDYVDRLYVALRERGIESVVLPPDAKLYVKSRE